MEEQFVPYELALKLKELGFRQYTHSNYGKSIFGYFYNKKFCYNSGLRPHHNLDESLVVTAPFWQQAFDWFREEHKLHVIISPSRDEIFYPKIEELNQPRKYDNDITRIVGGFDYNNAKQEALEKLIEIVKNKQK